MKDTARVLARIYDGIEYRGFKQETVEELGRHGVPAWNGLTNEYHPTQVLGDLLTMEEFSDLPLPEISLCTDEICGLTAQLPFPQEGFDQVAQPRFASLGEFVAGAHHRLVDIDQRADVAGRSRDHHVGIDRIDGGA